MKTSYVFILLALIVPLAVCYPQLPDDTDEDREQMYGEGLAESDDDDSKLEDMLRMIQQTGGEEDEEGENEENGLIMQSEDEEEDDEPDIQSRRCATHIYVLGFTSGSRYSGSDDLPYLYVSLFNREAGSARFRNNLGDDMVKNKGDCWIFSLRRDLKLRKSCITKADINRIVIRNGGNDGWKIQSIFTILRSGGYYSVVTANVGLNKILDGNPVGRISFRNIVLTKTYNS